MCDYSEKSTHGEIWRIKYDLEVKRQYEALGSRHVYEETILEAEMPSPTGTAGASQIRNKPQSQTF